MVLGKNFLFEIFQTENSYKYTVSSFQNLAELSNFKIIDVLKDKKSFFFDSNFDHNFFYNKK